jgi:hypothetical protein
MRRSASQDDVKAQAPEPSMELFYPQERVT